MNWGRDGSKHGVPGVSQPGTYIRDLLKPSGAMALIPASPTVSPGTSLPLNLWILLLRSVIRLPVRPVPSFPAGRQSFIGARPILQRCWETKQTRKPRSIVPSTSSKNG